MNWKESKYNPKKELARLTEALKLTLERLVGMVKYTGSPFHKRNPGDFALTPPAAPRNDRTLCDEAGITSKITAVRLLRLGIKLGLVSEQNRNGFPKYIWSVENGESPIVFEAILENEGTGQYHGYPLKKNDPIYEDVLERWRKIP